MPIKLVVLDLDNTLLKTFSGTAAGNVYNRLNENPTVLARSYLLNYPELPWGIRRPHLDKFLDYLFNHIDIVAVWSAGSYEYVHEITKLIFGKRKEEMYVYTRNDCETDLNGNLYKPLKKMLDNIPGLMYKANLQNTIIIDDLDITFCQNPDNAIHIPMYEPSFEQIKMGTPDTALLKIINWLECYKDAPEDVREIPKKDLFFKPPARANLNDCRNGICALARMMIE